MKFLTPTILTAGVCTSVPVCETLLRVYAGGLNGFHNCHENFGTYVSVDDVARLLFEDFFPLSRSELDSGLPFNKCVFSHLHWNDIMLTQFPTVPEFHARMKN